MRASIFLASLFAVVVALLGCSLQGCGATAVTKADGRLLSWEGKGDSSTTSTSFELKAGDPVYVQYDVSGGKVDVDVSKSGEAIFHRELGVTKRSEMAYAASDGTWDVTVTSHDATGSVKVTCDVASDTFSKPVADATSAELANPYVEVEEVGDLSDAAQFEVSFPDRIEGFGDVRGVDAMPGDLAEASYGDERNWLLVRKGHGDEVYRLIGQYEEDETTDVSGAEVHLLGNGGRCFAATWSRDGFDYAVSAGMGVSRDEMTAVVSQIS